jgi:glycosyltransferase involved in cell wall biosynthesis
VPNHPRGKVYEGYKNRFYQKETIDGINVVRLWTYVTPNEGFVKRTINYISYFFMAILVSPFLPKSDVVISTSPQFFCGLAGFPVKIIKRCLWVLEIRDLWPESILTVGAIKNRFVIIFLEYLERFAYIKCDHIVAVTDAFKAYMVNMGINEHKISVIKNGVNLDVYRPFEVQVRDELSNLYGNYFVASYVGTHGMAHHLETILEAAELLKDRKDIIFLMIGDGAEKRKLVELKNSKSLENVVMLDQQPRSMMPEYWAVSDLSLVLLRKSDLFKSVIPSKIFESMAMNKPIILGVEGEVKEIIEEACSGVAIEPENASQLAEAVKELADDKKKYQAFCENGRKYVEKYFNRSVLADRYLKVMSDIIE